MKNTKEMQAILTAIYCINLTGSNDKILQLYVNTLLHVAQILTSE